ncbi:hypothetical protein B0H14DRAFT_3136128 [Mycena olivaceomarginata]|nr:hypothetical protein B0H14DRAFT_3136128 [Mycena olivaceomarginata]
MWAKITSLAFANKGAFKLQHRRNVHKTIACSPQDGCVRDREHRKSFQETDRQEDLGKFWQLSAGYTKKKVQGTQRGGPKKETNAYVPRNETRCRIESIRGEGRTKTLNKTGLRTRVIEREDVDPVKSAGSIANRKRSNKSVQSTSIPFLESAV